MLTDEYQFDANRGSHSKLSLLRSMEFEFEVESKTNFDNFKMINMFNYFLIRKIYKFNMCRKLTKSDTFLVTFFGIIWN